MLKEITLYVGKLCLNSHINQVENNRDYDEYRKDLNKYILELFYLINNNREFVYTDEIEYLNETKKEIEKSYIDYRLFIREINEDYIYADLRRDNIRYYQDENEKGEIISKPVENVENITFFLDLKSEYIIYNTKANFGHKEFRVFFGKYINTLMRNSKKYSNLEFEIIAIKNKGSVKEFYKKIKKAKNIKELNIEYIPVNANSKLFDKLINSKDDYQNSFENTNATRKSLVFTSSDPNGLNIKSEEIKDSINSASDIENILTIEGVSHGFVKLSAESDIRVYSTDETKPYKDKKRKGESFLDASKRTILNIISELIKNKNDK